MHHSPSSRGSRGGDGRLRHGSDLIGAGALLCALMMNAEPVPAQLAHEEIPAALRETLREAGPVRGAVQLRFSSPAASTSPLVRIWQDGGVELGRATEGLVRVQHFHAGTLHGVQNGLRAVQWGISDFATCYVSSNSSAFLLASVWSLPFVAADDPTVGSWIANEVMQSFGREEFSAHGVELGHRTLTAPQNLYTRTPVENLEDLRGLKIAAIGDDLKTLRALGAVPVALQFTDFYFALQRGLVDGVLWNDVGVLAYRILEVARHRLSVRISSSAIDYCVSRDFLARAPDGFGPVFSRYNEAMAVIEPFLAYSGRRAQIEEALRAAGVTTSELEAGELERWRVATRPVVDAWLRETRSRRVGGAELLLEIERLKARYGSAPPETLLREVLHKAESSELAGRIVDP